MGNIAEELTKAQEDFLETTGSDAYYDKKIEQQDRKEEYYSDWLSDNLSELRKEFCEEHHEFEDYCKDAFREHKADLV